MRRASIITAMILVVAGSIASAQPSGFSVPLAETPSMYEGRSEVTFAVKECRGRGAFGGIERGEILRASQSAASVWNEVFPRVRISVAQGNCRLEPATNNGTNEIYWTDRPMPAERFGLYVAATQGPRLMEEDILLKANNIEYVAGELDASPERVLLNALVHEFGHALGLGDAYREWPDACGWSAMLALCSAEPLRPTSADLQALRSIYGTSSDDALNPPSSSSGSLRRFDTNDNGYIDDPEFSTAMDQWLAGEVGDELFLELIDAWTSGRKLKSAAIDDGLRFNVTSVTVFKLSGDRVGRSACSSRAAMDRADRMLDREPQGTYLAVVRDCQTGETRTEKIAQLR